MRQTVFLSKQVLTTVVADGERCSDDRSSWSLYTSKVDLVLHETVPGAKRPLRMVSAFPGKYASIAAVDLIKLKKLDSQKFYESNLTEARFEIILFSTSQLRIMTVGGNSGYPLNLSFNNMEKEQ